MPAPQLPRGRGGLPDGGSPTAREPAAKAPTASDLAEAAGRTVPDVLSQDLNVLFCGINPSLYSAATGHHFARPGNRFWPVLHRSGFTDRLLRPTEDSTLPAYGLGVTNLVARATARADELTRAEMVAGAARLTELVATYRPRWVAVVGVTAYRVGYGRPKAVVGAQPQTLAGAGLWVLPNPSGLNAHYQVDRLTREFAMLRRATADLRA